MHIVLQEMLIVCTPVFGHCNHSSRKAFLPQTLEDNEAKVHEDFGPYILIHEIIGSWSVLSTHVLFGPRTDWSANTTVLACSLKTVRLLISLAIILYSKVQLILVQLKLEH